MLILKPLSKETIWGGDRLHSFCGDKAINNLGQLYTVIAEKGYSNEIINGEFKGKTLYEIYKDNRDLFTYDKYEDFPLIIGFVDAKENLSLQIHPTDEFAKMYENKPFGKNESWIFIETPNEGYIYNGCKLNKIEEILDKVNKDKWSEIIDTLNVKKGDYVYVESGTFHALTTGSLVYEIQQSTNLTYRFYDYGRINDKGIARELHIDKALKVLDPLKKSKAVDTKDMKKFNEKYYSTEIFNLKESYRNIYKSFICITIMEGEVRINNKVMQKGMSVILFKDEELKVKGEALVVVAYPI